MKTTIRLTIIFVAAATVMTIVNQAGWVREPQPKQPVFPAGRPQGSPDATEGSKSTSGPVTTVQETAARGEENCFKSPPFPLSPLELELQRLYELVVEVMAEVNATYWPADATLLGLMRNGRVATDRDLDFQIHSTYERCHGLLSSLKGPFARRAKIKSFKVATTKMKGKKIGRYVMVRLFRKHGDFDTGADFNCVYTDDAEHPMYFTHKNVLTEVPPAVYPLGSCSVYGHPRPCPRDGMAFLHTLKPRYEGCMAFPHCFGDPTKSVKQCLSPHPERPLQEFMDTIKSLHDCGFTSLHDHAVGEPLCAELQANAEKNRQCQTIGGSKFCFLQKFNG